MNNNATALTATARLKALFAAAAAAYDAGDYELAEYLDAKAEALSDAILEAEGPNLKGLKIQSGPIEYVFA